MPFNSKHMCDPSSFMESHVQTPSPADRSPWAFPPKDACRQIGCGMTTLYQEIAAGRIEARKMGKKTLIPAESLRAYLDALPKANLTTNQRRFNKSAA